MNFRMDSLSSMLEYLQWAFVDLCSPNLQQHGYKMQLFNFFMKSLQIESAVTSYFTQI